MSADRSQRTAVSSPPSGPISGSSARAPIAWRQVAFITLGALAIFATMRWLPTGTNLSHMDFRVDAKNPIDFCDPLNPQFIPVVAVASPVTMKLTTDEAVAGREVQATLMLRTASGKPIAPGDLLVVHTQRLHLLIADPALGDYQHVHPQPTRTAGEWRFSFTPHASGTYRIFADFTPTATNRGLYANADLNVGAGERPISRDEQNRAQNVFSTWTVERGGYRFELVPAATPIRARQPADLKFVVTHANGAAVPLEPVMGAYAHLVAFDEARSGFAHLHPMQADPLQKPDALRPTLDFKITIPQPGRYVIWAQVNLAGRDTFAPFWFDVVE